MRLFLIVFALVFLCQAHQRRASLLGECNKRRSLLTCEHAVVGAGPVGAYMAWQLKKNFPGRSVCLFERSSQPGGRFDDVPHGTDGGRLPNGGMRWREFGNYTMAIYTRLANELGITRDADIITDFMGSTTTRARGGISRASQDLVQWYGAELALRGAAVPGCNTQCQIYRQLVARYNNDTQYVAQAGNLRNYIQLMFNDETADFIRDLERLRSYHDDITDAPFYMDTYIWQARYDGPRAYPDGGMSEFPRRMVQRFVAMGGSFYPDTYITDISEDAATGGFRLLSERFLVEAQKIALAFPGFDYANVQGSVVEKVRSTPEFQSSTPNPCVTVQQVWPNRFWEQQPGTPVFVQGQAGTTGGYGNYAHVFTPSTRFTYTRNVTRTVYVDDLIKVHFWQQLYATQGLQGVEREAIRHMQTLMPNATIPTPIRTHYYYTPGIHAVQKAGSYNRGLTNARILQWAATQPVASIARCKLVLSTDTWNPKYVGWAMAGWQVVIDWFQACEGITIDPAIDYCNPYTGAPINRTWCDCRPGVPIPPEGLAYIAQNCPRAKREEKDTFEPEYGPIDG